MKSFITKLGLTVMMACLFSVAPVSAQDVMSPAQMKELAKQQKIAEKQQKQLEKQQKEAEKQRKKAEKERKKAEKRQKAIDKANDAAKDAKEAQEDADEALAKFEQVKASKVTEKTVIIVLFKRKRLSTESLFSLSIRHHRNVPW